VPGLLLVALGGALGSVLRYLATALAVRWLGVDFPWGTLAVNLAGSFAIGLVNELGADALRLSPQARLFLATGVLGGLTTYSAFSYETVRLMERGAWGPAWLNVVGTTVACLTLCYVGLLAGRMVMGPR
jgi:fluoride exporter